MDEFNGQGGTYQVVNGKRERVEKATKPHEDGARARDAEGKPIVVEQVNQPAMPQPVAAPWATPANNEGAA